MPYEVVPREIRYLKRNYYRGDAIEPATELDATRLKLVGKIREVETPSKQTRGRNMPKAPRRAVVAEPSESAAPPADPSASSPSQVSPARSGHYHNRRLKTDD